MRTAAIKAPKARSAEECERLEQLPNIGPSVAALLRRIGILHPRDLQRGAAEVTHEPLGADGLRPRSDVGGELGEPQRTERAAAQGCPRGDRHVPIFTLPGRARD